ncbi:MAG: hypothetical protein LN569_04610 [Rickettsia endosymbiont of Labidopullus appendiculatus]|nr:hypothetical protein [Rickettsia endosymbiont of Labidopullus appendiculatus]
MEDKSPAEKLTLEKILGQLSLIPGNFTCNLLNADRADFPIEKKEELNEYKHNDMYPYFIDF